MQASLDLDSVFDTEGFETIEESSVSYITRAHFSGDAQRWIIVKSASVLREFSKQPHDIGKELRFLQRLSYANIIELLGYAFERSSNSIHFWMPYIPHSLHDLLNSPQFVPVPLAHDATAYPEHIAGFIKLTTSIMYQIINAIAYLHEHRIAHRDIKPRNMMLAEDCCVKLIDFGISWSDSLDERDLWPEPLGEMCFDVSTGPYRAPELLFGATNYDAYATDMWSLGATFAEFFMPLKLRQQYSEYDADDDSDSEEELPKQPFIVPHSLAPGGPDHVWKRESLFDASRGSIGLAWSIFKVRGTPSEDSWPEFNELPDANKVSFEVVPPVDLTALLPNIPTVSILTTRPDIPGSFPTALLDLLEQLLTYPPLKRPRPAAIRPHPLFTDSLPILLPAEHPDLQDIRYTVVWNDRQLKDLLLDTLHAPN